jgi:antitoxin YefM
MPVPLPTVTPIVIARQPKRRYSFLYIPEGWLVRTVNFTELRGNLAAELDSVINDAEELVVTRSGHEPVVIVSLAEYQSMKETEYLLRNPNNAAALRQSIAELERGDVAERELFDPDAERDIA